MPVDEMIIASINCLDEIEEHFKTQMIAWVRSAADFGEINDKLVKENEQLKQKIEQMKCCALCKFLSFDNVDLFCNARDEYVDANAVCKKWEQKNLKR